MVRARGLVACREAARSTVHTVANGARAGGRGRDARPPPPAQGGRGTVGRTDGGGRGGGGPPPGRAVADQGTDGGVAWEMVRQTQMGSYYEPRRGGGGRTLADIFRDIGNQPAGNGAGGDGSIGGGTADTEPITEAGSSRADDREALCIATWNISDGRVAGLESAGRALEAEGSTLRSSRSQSSWTTPTLGSIGAPSRF